METGFSQMEGLPVHGNPYKNVLLAGFFVQVPPKIEDVSLYTVHVSEVCNLVIRMPTENWVCLTKWLGASR